MINLITLKIFFMKDKKISFLINLSKKLKVLIASSYISNFVISFLLRIFINSTYPYEIRMIITKIWKNFDEMFLSLKQHSKQIFLFHSENTLQFLKNSIKLLLYLMNEIINMKYLIGKLTEVDLLANSKKYQRFYLFSSLSCMYSSNLMLSSKKKYALFTQGPYLFIQVINVMIIPSYIDNSEEFHHQE